MRKYLLFLTIGLILFTSLILWSTSYKTDQRQQVAQEAPKGDTDIGGDFTLTDQNAKTVQAADFHGRAMLVFFGFTHCPDECPATVLMLSKMMSLLGDKGDRVAPLFITVDPKRDTPPVMKDFLANFDKRITGLTGTPEQIKKVADEYKIYFSVTPVPAKDGKGEDYGVDHSAFIYMMGKDGKYIRLFPYDVSAEELARAIQAYLS